MKGRVRQRGFSLVELMVAVTIVAILATIAIPTFQLFFRRVKTSEARVMLAKMFDSTVLHFSTERLDDRPALETIGAGVGEASMTHRCPHPVGSVAGGEAGVTPDLSVNCNDGPGGRCVPAGTGQGSYPFALWDSNQVWEQLDFQLEQAHYFHYNYRAANEDVGRGQCRFTAEAFGDLDDDGEYSTFSRGGAADAAGVTGSMLFLRRVVE